MSEFGAGVATLQLLSRVVSSIRLTQAASADADSYAPRVQEGITAVLTSSPTDVLSHVAIRARSQGVLLATCFDEAELGNLEVRLFARRNRPSSRVDGLS